jgi:hypothetical protein
MIRGSRMSNENDRTREFSSFRDPSGIVYKEGGTIYRQINSCYKEQYDYLMQSGLYADLTNRNMLIEHQETPKKPITDSGVLVLTPQQIPFVSYPYEWAFSALKEAALLSLKIHRKALDYGMVLKDASAYNIQFQSGRPILIDTLSFDFYHDGEPWAAYGQFCRHLLAPLLLMRYVDIRLSRLMSLYIDGIPLDLASRLLKGKGGIFTRQHIHWHSKSIADNIKESSNTDSIRKINIPKKNMIALIESMILFVEGLELKDIATRWSDYETTTSYSETGAASKKELVEKYLKQINPSVVWDFGANDGTYSRLALGLGSQVAAFDSDPAAVEKNFNTSFEKKQQLLSLYLDLSNPSPNIGFANRERTSIGERQHPDCIMMLAVIHHVVISNNVPFVKLADWLSSLCRHLIIEFVPKEDPQVQKLLLGRLDIFDDYSEGSFEDSFGTKFNMLQKDSINDSNRVLYLYECK